MIALDGCKEPKASPSFLCLLVLFCKDSHKKHVHGGTCLGSSIGEGEMDGSLRLAGLV